MAQLVKHLTANYEDLAEFSLSYHITMPDMMLPAGTPTAGEAEAGGSLGSLAIWYRLIDKLQDSERPSLDGIPDGDT